MAKTLVPLNDDLTAGPQWTSPPAELTDILASEIAAWERQRNDSGVRIKWMFTTAKARAKMGRAYPKPTDAKMPSLKES